MNTDMITPQYLEELYKNDLLWFLVAGLENDWIETYEDEGVSMEIAMKIRELLPQVSMPEEERKRMDDMLDRTIDIYGTDIQQSKY